MPRLNSRSKKGNPSWVSYAHKLSDDAQNELISILQCDSEKNEMVNKALKQVEHWLSFYSGGLEALDNAPRPADYKKIFQGLKKQSGKLLNELTEMNDFYREQFTVENSTIELIAIEASLASIINVSAAVIKKYENEPSEGAPRNIALIKVILNLRGIFRKYYCGKHTGRTRQGAFEKKSIEEKNEIEFVKISLLDANIIPKNNSYKALERHFRDSRCKPK